MAYENKKTLIKNRSLFNINETKKEIIQNPKLYSQNNLPFITKKNFNLDGSSKDLANFIKKKNFFMENSFDVNGTRAFLASKEVAMRAIELNDEIIETNKGKSNKNLSNANLLNFHDNDRIEKKTTKAEKKRTISPRKSRKGHKIKNIHKMKSENKIIKLKKTLKSKKTPEKEKNKKISTNLESSSNNIDKESNIIFKQINDDSLSNIYKFIIDNANEPKETFQKKLKKELKKNKIRRKSKSQKNIEYKTEKRMNNINVNKKKNIKGAFMFSEINKNLMKKDDLEISSIEESQNDFANKNENKKEIKKVYNSIQLNNKQVKEKLKEKIENNKKVEINSDKDSLISILSDLI